MLPAIIVHLDKYVGCSTFFFFRAVSLWRNKDVELLLFSIVMFNKVTIKLHLMLSVTWNCLEKAHIITEDSPLFSMG